MDFKNCKKGNIIQSKKTGHAYKIMNIDKYMRSILVFCVFSQEAKLKKSFLRILKNNAKYGYVILDVTGYRKVKNLK